MNRRNFTAAALTAPLLTGCFWDRYFDIQWNEQVQQPDGRVFTVHLKVRFERLFREFTRYGGAIVPRDSTLTFDAGGDIGQVVQLFKGYLPIFLGQHNGTWYAVLSGKSYSGSQKEHGQNWQDFADSYGQFATKIVGKQFQAISKLDLPDEIQAPNMLWLNGAIQEHVAFEGRTITLAQKDEWKRAHRTDPESWSIPKPKAASTSAKTLTNSGDAK